MSEESREEWLFNFGLCRNLAAEDISSARCEELFNLIIEWADRNKYGIGGGYRAFTEEDFRKPSKKTRKSKRKKGGATSGE